MPEKLMEVETQPIALEESTGSPRASGDASVTDSPQVSVLILTRNEEINIEACLKSLAFSNDIVLLDSLSTDRTLEIARMFPHVRTMQRPFDTEWKQRNFGLHCIAYQNRWVYICDADERVPPELAEEILAVARVAAPEHAAYRLRYKNIYMGRWIKHASSYPVWIMRLVRPDRVAYEVRETNVHPIVDGTTGSLQKHFVHYSFNSGLRRWFQKHNFYSTREAMEGVKIRRGPRPRLRLLRGGDPMTRRRTMKNLSYFLTGRAFFRFIASYIFGRGCLDGMPGLHYCLMISMYEYWIELKINEQEAHWNSRTDQLVEQLLREPTR